jgi:hypothetical protein
VLACLLLAAGCTRDELPWSGPELETGDLVVTEARGDQSGTDGYGEWLEIYNASAGEVDLAGLELRLRRIDGSASGTVLVREALPAAAGDYVVLGRFASGAEPDHVDQGWLLPCAGSASGCDEPWLDGGLYDAAAVELYARDTLIDRAIYRDLPSTGSWALDGASVPSAADNDDEDRWCADQTTDAQTPELGIRGTPGEANPPC